MYVVGRVLVFRDFFKVDGDYFIVDIKIKDGKICLKIRNFVEDFEVVCGRFYDMFIFEVILDLIYFLFEYI